MHASRPPWWLWPNILHLDAPLIAVVWQCLFARAAGVEPSATAALGLGLSVWVIYAADRVIDGRSPAVGPESAVRHQFARRHAVGFAGAILIAGGVGILLAFRLPGELFAAGVGLAGLVLGYFWWNFRAGGRFGRGWLKEGVIGIVFATGSALDPLLRAPSWGFGLGVLGFAVLGFGNCLMIARLERDLDLARGERSLAGRFAPSARPARAVSVGLAAVVIGVGVVVGFSALTTVLVGSSALLAITGGIERHCGPVAAVVWADFALLAPAVVVLVVGYGT